MVLRLYSGRVVVIYTVPDWLSVLALLVTIVGAVLATIAILDILVNGPKSHASFRREPDKGQIQT